MTSEPALAIRDIYHAAVRAVQPETVLQRAMRRDANRLVIGDQHYDVSEQPVYAMAVGKAAVEMLSELESILNGALAGGLAIAKTVPENFTAGFRIVRGSHPVPDQRSLEAGSAALEFARSVPDDAIVLCLISGGGSALMESLHSGLNLDDLQAITRALLRAGASIHELNAVRSRISAIKAGGLLSAFGASQVVNIVISDVLGDDPATIASGPTVPVGNLERAEDVLERYGVEFDLPTPKQRGGTVPPNTIIAGNLSLAVEAAAERATDLGYQPAILTRSLTGEARHIGTTFAAILADSRLGQTAFSSGCCLIAGGETTVTVRGDGHGGRNTEAALAAAIRLSGAEGVALGFLATDGDDAETGVAGGIVTGRTVSQGETNEAKRALEENDSFTWLNQAGAAWGPGPTGTNVNDLVIGIVT